MGSSRSPHHPNKGDGKKHFGISFFKLLMWQSPKSLLCNGFKQQISNYLHRWLTIIPKFAHRPFTYVTICYIVKYRVSHSYMSTGLINDQQTKQKSYVLIHLENDQTSKCLDVKEVPNFQCNLEVLYLPKRFCWERRISSNLNLIIIQ